MEGINKALPLRSSVYLYPLMLTPKGVRYVFLSVDKKKSKIVVWAGDSDVQKSIAGVVP